MKTPVVASLLILILYSNCIFSFPVKNNPLIIKTNLGALAQMSEINLYVETVDIIKRKGLEIGFSCHSPHNSVNFLYSDLMGFSATRTGGGQYGLETISPFYMAGHKGYSVTVNLKFYKKNLITFFGPQLVLAYRELLNSYYTDHDREGPGYTKGYYEYTANHYSKKIGILANYGYNRGLGKRRVQAEAGAAIGVNFNFDNLQLLSWGAHTQNADPNFIHYDEMKGTKHTDGFHVTPAVRLYFKIGLDFSR